MGLLILFAVGAIAFSFLCSIWEAVLLSITPSYVNSEISKGSSLGKSLQTFKDDIDRPLSAILTLNTVAHTVGAIMVGKQTGKAFDSEESLFTFGPFDLGFTNLGPFDITMDLVVSVVMTILILVLSEIIPKTIGANYWKRLVPFTVTSLKVLMWILAPAIWLTQLITKFFKSDLHGSVLSRADFTAMAKVGQEQGVIQQNESTIIKNVLDLSKIKIKDIMTPSIVMTIEDESQTIDEVYKGGNIKKFSRIPVYNEDPKFVTGVVLKDEIMSNIISGNGASKLSSIKRDIKTFNQETDLSELFKTLTKDGEHIAIVSNEFGTITGLVTLEDLFETLIGMEITDEYDEDADMRLLAKKVAEQRRNS